MSMTTKEMIAVMQAFEEGKTIEFTPNSGFYVGKWTKVDRPSWDWPSAQYRVKPEPVGFYAVVYTFHGGGEFYSTLRLTKEEAEIQAQAYVAAGGTAARVVKLREVLDES